MQIQRVKKRDNGTARQRDKARSGIKKLSRRHIKKIEATERIYTLTQPASPNLKKSLRPVLNLSIGLSNLKILT